MIKRFIDDESGVALGLAVIMIVLIGVMGAGLLVFVRNDLETVIEVNQGQQAINMADAGVQAAKNHLLTKNADFLSYNGTTDLAADPPDLADSDWSCGPWDASAEKCTGTGHELSSLDSEPDADARVWIQYLKPSTTTSELDDPTFAPELVPAGETNYPPGKDYFKVLAEGYSGDAVRKVEAIYNTYDLDVPKAYYTRGNINWNGNAGTLENMSLFAGGNVTGKASTSVSGTDLNYGNWCVPGSNTAARSVADAGIGALGTVENADGTNENPDKGRDFGSNTSPQFTASSAGGESCSPASSTNQPTFPFRPALPDIEDLRLAAQSQSNGAGGDNHYEATSSTAIQEIAAGTSAPYWPDNSLSSTVVFVKFDDIGDSLTWDVGNGGNPAPVVRGTLVVENGTFNTQPNKDALRGVVVVDSAGPGTEVYTDTGNTNFESFVIASGDIKIGGNIGSFTEERANRPGFYNIRQWSWRECYSENCR